ncbi:hypothetical protein [Undibacterium sp.]|uniref:hypothetical protein n=1 Tax=Undibacterium sp. TaxID=1914977 RepID=UPI00374D6F13
MIPATHIFLLTTFVRKLAIGGAMAAFALLTGCAAVSPRYAPTIDNVKVLQALPGGSAKVGEFTAKEPALNHLSIRAGAYTSPYNDSYAEYFKEALLSELESSGKLNRASKAVITGQLLKNSVDASIGTGTAMISVRVKVDQDSAVVFDKVISAETHWESSFMGAIAIPAARSNYVNTVTQTLGKLFADPDFQRAIH